jgi:hypothetical protein
MDAVTLHLRTNHFPIILSVVATVAAVLALVLRKEGIWRYALVTALLAGLTAPIAYWTGDRAEDMAGEFENIALEHMADHEESAKFALAGLLVAGGAAVLALAKPNLGTRIGFLAVSLAATGLTGYTSSQAGKIVHNAMTQGIPDTSK